MSAEKFGRYKAEAEERMERKERLALRNKVESGGKKHLDIYYLVEIMQRERNANVFARPNGLRENAETAIPCGRPRPAKKKKEVYQ